MHKKFGIIFLFFSSLIHSGHMNRRYTYAQNVPVLYNFPQHCAPAPERLSMKMLIPQIIRQCKYLLYLGERIDFCGEDSDCFISYVHSENTSAYNNHLWKKLLGDRATEDPDVNSKVNPKKYYFDISEVFNDKEGKWSRAFPQHTSFRWEPEEGIIRYIDRQREYLFACALSGLLFAQAFDRLESLNEEREMILLRLVLVLNCFFADLAASPKAAKILDELDTQTANKRFSLSKITQIILNSNDEVFNAIMRTGLVPQTLPESRKPYLDKVYLWAMQWADRGLFCKLGFSNDKNEPRKNFMETCGLYDQIAIPQEEDDGKELTKK